MRKRLPDSMNGNEAAFEKMVNINQKGVFDVRRRWRDKWSNNMMGVIRDVSAESGLEGSEGQSCYAATKAALNSFTRVLVERAG